MVANFQEEIDSEDEDDVFSPPSEPSASKSKVVTSYDIELSTDEDDEPAVAADVDISDDDRKQKKKGSSGMGDMSGGILGSFGMDSVAKARSRNSVTLEEKVPTTSSSSDDELPPGILEVSKRDRQQKYLTQCSLLNPYVAILAQCCKLAL